MKRKPKQAQRQKAGKDLLGRNRVIGLKTIAGGVNPKDRIGAAKVDLTLIPVSAKVALATALQDGGDGLYGKYGAYNWRKEPVLARTYLAACERHTDAYREGETLAPDSRIKHLAHAMACLAILIDAESQGMLVDDRPINGKPEVIYEANDFVKQRQKEYLDALR